MANDTKHRLVGMATAWARLRRGGALDAEVARHAVATRCVARVRRVLTLGTPACAPFEPKAWRKQILSRRFKAVT